MGISTLIDKAIGAVSPKRQYERTRYRAATAMLATYDAATTGRRNKDWRTGGSGSADLAIIPDSRILNARARQLTRDSWIATSAIKAACRNIVGTGIIPVPMAHDLAGKPLVAFNSFLQKSFWRWANKAESFDVEQRQNFWQKQSLLVSERFTVGEGFLVWSYRPPIDSQGKVDLRRPVGLRFQSFESEMLDLTKQSYGDNEVRGGIEIDEDGKPVAYHFWTRNPSDYLFRRQMHSVRVPAERVIHYFKQDRVLQTRGITPLAPVMQNIRDFDRYQNAMMWVAIMEACSGMFITRNIPTMLGGSPTLVPDANDTGSTESGMRKADFVPGMVIEGAPGEDAKFLTPQHPGNQFETYNSVTLRGIGAGIGMSYGLLARHFDANYSAARQDMLEDDRQWGPEQDLLIDGALDKIYVLYVRFAAMEGRFDDLAGWDMGEFLYDEARFVECEHIKPAKPWIDPEKEMNAAEKALQNQLKTREQLVAEMGGRWRDVMMHKAEEMKLADGLALDFPEDKRGEFRRKLLETVAANRNAGSIIANSLDIPAEIRATGATVRPGYKQEEIPLQPITPAATPAQTEDEPSKLSAGANPPGYKLSVLSSVKCSTCAHYDLGTNEKGNQPRCLKFDVDVEDEMVCDAWGAPEIGATTNSSKGRTLPPYPAPGSPPIDQVFANQIQGMSARMERMEGERDDHLSEAMLAIAKAVGKIGEVHVHIPESLKIAAPDVVVEAPIVLPPQITVAAPIINVPAASIEVNPVIHSAPPTVIHQSAPAALAVPEKSRKRKITKEVKRDKAGEIDTIIETEEQL